MQTGGHEKSRPCLSCENRDSLAASKSPPFENREGRGSPLLAGAPARHEERSNCWTGIPRNATLHNRAAQGLDVRHLPSPSPCGRGEVFSLDIPFYRTPPALHPSQSRETRTRGGTARLAVEQLSSLSFRGGRGGRNRVAVDCAKEGTDGSHAADCGSKSNSPPCHCKGRSDKDGATSSVEMKGRVWASPPQDS